MRRYREENRHTKSRSNQIFNSLIIFGLTLLLDLILFGALGKSGNVVKNFLLGTFGFVIYGFGIAMILMSILMFFGVRRKASAKIIFIYLGILLAVVFMCHLATTKGFASLKYVDYLMYCYNSATSACGIIGAVILYPLAKLYVFSMVILGLAIAGLVALAIVMQLNHEIIVHAFKREKKAKNQLDNVIKQDSEVGSIAMPHETKQQVIERKSLYNCTPTGQVLPNDFGKVKAGKPPVYQPIDNMNTLVEDENVIDISKTLIDPKEIEDDIKRKQREAIDDIYGLNGGKPDVSEYFVLPNIKGSRFSKNATPDKKADANKDIAEIDQKYKKYSNNYRKAEIEKTLNRQYEESHKSEQVDDNNIDYSENKIDKNSDINNFCDDIEMVMNQHLKENRGSLNDIFGDERDNNVNKMNSNSFENVGNASGMVESANDNVEDLTIKNQNESMLDHIKKMNKKKAQDEFDNLFENPKTVNFDSNKSPNKSEFDKYKEQAFGVGDKKPPLKKRTQAYIPPDVSCLKDYNEFVKDSTDIQEKVRVLEEKMSDCGIDISIENVVRGPRFSRIEFSTTTQLNKIMARERDIAMWLSAKSLRVLTPIPGTPYCGIEIPNASSGIVGMKTIVNSPEFNNTKKGAMCFALGKDIDGHNYVANICEFPHGLVAGATGAGKSVCLNALLCSILFKYSPEEVRMILVDPKKVEFNMYKNIPHLLIPNILTEERQVISALKWVVKQMEERYELLMVNSVTNTKQYNEKVGAKGEKLPMILVVVDEVGDIIQSSIGKEFEGLVKRLAAKSRAAGIHLILATQRPTVDVITGTIKANFPTRIAFAVSQSVDSISILDSGGAEKLLRYGDMLYKDSIGSPLARIQGCFIDTSEVYAVVQQVKERNESIFDDSIAEEIMKTNEPEEIEISDKKISFLPDEKCVEVLEWCLENDNFSISNLQRNFTFGFPRAAKISDWLIKMGYVRVEGNTKTFVLSEKQVAEIKQREIDANK